MFGKEQSTHGEGTVQVEEGTMHEWGKSDPMMRKKPLTVERPLLLQGEAIYSW